MGLFGSARDSGLTKIAVWLDCEQVGSDTFGYRRDAFGNLMLWSAYGQRSGLGWEIDHIVPKALGGSDALFNLRALAWRANASLGGLLGNALSAGREHKSPRNALLMTRP